MSDDQLEEFLSQIPHHNFSLALKVYSYSDCSDNPIGNDAIVVDSLYTPCPAAFYMGQLRPCARAW